MTKMYRKLVEHNSWEGEDWNFWLQIDGNEQALDTLAQILEGYEGEYELTDEDLPEDKVDTLVANAEEGYMVDENKVDGVLTLGDGEFDVDKLYKGGICDFFKTAADA